MSSNNNNAYYNNTVQKSLRPHMYELKKCVKWCNAFPNFKEKFSLQPDKLKCPEQPIVKPHNPLHRTKWLTPTSTKLCTKNNDRN